MRLSSLLSPSLWVSGITLIHGRITYFWSKAFNHTSDLVNFNLNSSSFFLIQWPNMTYLAFALIWLKSLNAIISSCCYGLLLWVSFKGGLWDDISEKFLSIHHFNSTRVHQPTNPPSLLLKSTHSLTIFFFFLSCTRLYLTPFCVCSISLWKRVFGFLVQRALFILSIFFRYKHHSSIFGSSYLSWPPHEAMICLSSSSWLAILVCIEYCVLYISIFVYIYISWKPNF